MSKVVKPSKSQIATETAELFSAQDHLVPSIASVHEHLSADKVGAMMTKAVVDHLVSVVEVNTLVCAHFLLALV